MSGPIVAEQAFITLLGMVNAGMAGRAGTDVASGVGLVNSITAMVTAVLSAVALGGTVAVSRARGAGKTDEANRAASQCLILSVGSAFGLAVLLIVFDRPVVEALFGASSEPVRAAAADYLVWSAAGYPFLAATLSASGVLRGAGDARTPMAVNIVMNAVNAAAGRAVIFGLSAGSILLVPPLGAAGAGIALSVARLAGTACYAGAFARGAGRFSFRSAASSLRSRFGRRGAQSDARADHLAAAAVLAVGIPAAVESLAFNGGKLLTQTYAAGLGAPSVAADYLAGAASGFSQVLLASLQMAVPPLVGAALGRGRSAEARTVVYLASFWGSIATAAVNLVGFVFAPSLLGLASDDPEVLSRAVAVFRLFCVLSPLLWAGSFIFPAGLRGAGDGRFTMLVAVVSMWSVRVGLGWLLAVPAGLGIMGIWIAMSVDWAVRCALFVPRIRGGAWLRERARP
jgi:putative MATE family efflux protein